MRRCVTACDFGLRLRRLDLRSDARRVLACLAATLSLAAQTDRDRYPIVKNGKVGFIDQGGSEVIAPRFFAIADMAHFREGLAPVVSSEGAGYIDEAGRFVIGPTEEWGQPRVFHEGIAGVLIWGKNGARNTAGFIDRSGSVIFSSADVDERTYFSEGLMPLRNHEGRWGFVDKSFQWVIRPKYEWAAEFSEGLAAIESDRKYGYVDKNGTEIIPPKYDLVWAFSDGLARVRVDIPTGKKAMTLEGLRAEYQDLYGFVDHEGREVIPLQFEWATGFHQNHAFVKPQGSALQSIIDKQGVLLDQPQYEQTIEFSEGLAAVRLGGRWGYINHVGTWAIEPRFTSADSFWHGLARVAWETIGDTSSGLDT